MFNKIIAVISNKYYELLKILNILLSCFLVYLSYMGSKLDFILYILLIINLSCSVIYHINKKRIFEAILFSIFISLVIYFFIKSI